MQINADAVFGALEQTLGLLEDNERTRMERVLEASRSAVDQALLRILTAVADEVNASSELVRAEVVHVGDGAEFRVVTDLPAEGPAIEFAFDTDEIERLTLRLPSELKDLAALAAEHRGVSLNTWLTRLVGREATREPADAPGARDERRDREDDDDDDRRRGRRGRGRHGHGGQSLKGWIGG